MPPRLPLKFVLLTLAVFSVILLPATWKPMRPRLSTAASYLNFHGVKGGNASVAPPGSALHEQPAPEAEHHDEPPKQDDQKDHEPLTPSRIAQYVHSIMTPEDDTLPRLACRTDVGARYDRLRAPPGPRIKYLFALDLYESKHLLPRLIGSIVQAVRFLGPHNCAVSIVEGRSQDGTYTVLNAVRGDLEALGVTFYLTVNGVDPLAPEGSRIAALSELRNQALAPLTADADRYDDATTVIFLNDISLCANDILELVFQHDVQKADMTCALDWIANGELFYDVWVARGINGDTFFEVPQNADWSLAKNLFWNDLASRKKVDDRHPLQVYACWNGFVAFTAKPFIDKSIAFRTSQGEECMMGEPTLLAKDFWRQGLGRIMVVPSVNVAYDNDQAVKTKIARGSVEDRIDIRNPDPQVPAVEWQRSPPGQVKCLPEWHRPSWVPPV